MINSKFRDNAKVSIKHKNVNIVITQGGTVYQIENGTQRKLSCQWSQKLGILKVWLLDTNEIHLKRELNSIICIEDIELTKSIDLDVIERSKQDLDIGKTVPKDQLIEKLGI